MIEIHIDADDAHIYTHVDTKDIKLRQSFIVEALTNARAILNETNTKAVIFVVARDLEQNIDYKILLKQFLRDGHVIGNHSYSHSENFHDWCKELQIKDVERADEVISDALNYKSIYFRGPGYSSSHAVQRSLLKMRYVYDCTKIPLIYSSALDIYFKVNSSGRKSFPSILRLQDLHFSLSGPIPGIKELSMHANRIYGIPIYSTWLFRKRRSSREISRRLEKTQNLFLFHAIDFLDYSNARSGIPALRIDSQERFRIIKEILLLLKSQN